MTFIILAMTARQRGFHHILPMGNANRIENCVPISFDLSKPFASEKNLVSMVTTSVGQPHLSGMGCGVKSPGHKFLAQRGSGYRQTSLRVHTPMHGSCGWEEEFGDMQEQRTFQMSCRMG